MKETFRRGRPVIKTTIEFPRSTYADIKNQAAKEGKSLKEWLTQAAIEKLLGKVVEPEERAELYKISIRNNSTTNKIYEILNKYIPESFSAALIIVSSEKADIDYTRLEAENIPDIKPHILRTMGHIFTEADIDEIDSELEKLIH